MSPVDRLWLDVLWELDRERQLGQAPPGKAVIYREGVPLARVADDDDNTDPASRATRRPRVVITDDAVEVALAMARLSPASSSSSSSAYASSDDDGRRAPPLRPMLAVSAHEARRWASEERTTRRSASAEGGVLLRTNAWNGLRPVALDPQRQTLAELLGEGALDDLPITNRELAEDEACVVTGVAARRTLTGEPCALSSRADLDVVAYPRPALQRRGGTVSPAAAAVEAHLGLVFQTAQMFGKDAVVVCVDLETARDPQGCAHAREVGARALREGAFRDVVFVVPPAEAPAIAVDALAGSDAAPLIPPEEEETQKGEREAAFASDVAADDDTIFALASCEPPPLLFTPPPPAPPTVPPPPPIFFPPPPREQREDVAAQTEDDDVARGGEEGRRSGAPAEARPRIVFEVRTSDASADLDDRLDEWQFCGGAQKTFPLSGGGGNDSGNGNGRCPQTRKPLSPEDRQVSIRLVRHLARALLATLATRAVPHAPGAYAWASIDVDAPVARVFLEVRAVSVA